MKRQRILIVTPSVPYPPNWGFAIRVYQIVKHLSKRHDVTVLTFAHHYQAEHVETLRQDTGAKVVSVPPSHSDKAQRRAQLKSVFSRHSYSTNSLTTPEMSAALAQLLAENTFDFIQVESSQLGGYHYGDKATLVLDEHNIEYELLLRMCQTEKNFVRKIYSWWEYVKLRREETRFWKRADACVMTSEREAVVVRKYLPGKAVAVAPNGVDIEFYLPVQEPVDQNSIVFTGLMRYRPNIDAALYFAREVLPLIVKERPETVFTIVGMGQPTEVDALASRNVVVTGSVPDVRPYVERAAIFAVPLRMGSGTRLKVLEGLAMGKAMVSTSIGCEGINVVDGEHLIVADSPSEFARVTLQLLEDESRRLRLGVTGRQLVEDEYGWAAVVAGLEQFMCSLQSPEGSRFNDAPSPVAEHLENRSKMSASLSTQTTVDPKKPVRLPFLDGIRGLSAIWVVLFHLTYREPALIPAFLFWAKPFLLTGFLAVPIFIVLSGYSLMLPIARSGVMKGGLSNFFKRRVQRIAPPYYGVLFLFIVVGVVWQHFRPPSPIVLNVGTVSTHILMVHNWSRLTNLHIDAPMWSVATEVDIYVLFAVIMVPLWKKTGPVVTAASMTVLGLMPHMLAPLVCRAFPNTFTQANDINFDWVYPWFIGSFAVGGAVATLQYSSRPRDRKHLNVFAAIPLGLILVTLAVFYGSLPIILPSIHVDIAVEETLFSWAAAWVILRLSLKNEASGTDGSVPLRLLSSKPCAYIAGLSYSLYLTHHPISLVADRVLQHIHQHQTIGWIAVVVGSLALSVGVGDLTSRILEKPFLAKRG